MLATTKAVRNISKIIYSECINPHANLAHELSLLFDNKEISTENTLFLWRNKPVVVIGRHQNPYKECNRKFMKENRVELARRPTGGGAVYQDLGNTCWTFISKKMSPSVNNDIIVNALDKFGIKAYATGRNDIEVDGRKISGAAFRNTPNLCMHHGTMLMDVNMADMSQCLTVDRQKLAAKGVESVRSRVMNLREISEKINHETFCDSLIDSFKKAHGECNLIHMSASDVLKDENVLEKYKKLSSQSWIYGKNSDAKAQVSKKFAFGLFDLTIETHNGNVSSIRANTDCLFNDVTEEFITLLNKCVEKHTTKPLKELQNRVEANKKELANELSNWASSEIEKYL